MKRSNYYWEWVDESPDRTNIWIYIDMEPNGCLSWRAEGENKRGELHNQWGQTPLEAYNNLIKRMEGE